VPVRAYHLMGAEDFPVGGRVKGRRLRRSLATRSALDACLRPGNSLGALVVVGVLLPDLKARARSCPLWRGFRNVGGRRASLRAAGPRAVRERSDPAPVVRRGVARGLVVPVAKDARYRSARSGLAMGPGGRIGRPAKGRP
jgi:hypothetical protein